MELDLTGLRIEVTDAIRGFTEKKIEKLARYFEPSTICHVTFTDKVRGKQHVDIRIEYKSRTYLAEDEVEDLYTGIESLISKIEGQIRKDKSLMEKQRRDTIPQAQAEDIEAILDDEE